MPSSQKQTSTSSNTINPQQFQQYQDNYAKAQSNANSLTPYQGQITAGFNPTQTQAQGVLSTIATDPTYANNNNSAIGAVQGVLANPISASQLSGTNLDPYLNPYTKDVINTTNNAIGLQRQTANTQDNQQATAAGAFGGSRSGVANALTNQYYDQNTAATDAGLNQANFSQAQNAAAADIAAQNQTKQFNVNSQLTGANSLAALNNNGFSLAQQQAGLLSAVGDTQQQQAQTELTNAYNAYTQGQQLTLQQQQLLNQALGIIPIQQTTNGTTTTTSNPGAMGIIGGLGSLALAAGTGGASLGLTGALSGLGAASGAGGLLGLGNAVSGAQGFGMGGIGQLTGSNAAGFGGLFGASAPTVRAAF